MEQLTFLVTFGMFCLTAVAVLLTDIAKGLAYRVCIFVLSTISMILAIRHVQHEPEATDMNYERITFKINFKDSTSIDSVIIFK